MDYSHFKFFHEQSVESFKTKVHGLDAQDIVYLVGQSTQYIFVLFYSDE